VDLAIAEFILATSAGRLELSDLLRDIGEKVFRAITAFLPTRNCGDDAAVLANPDGAILVVTTDLLVDEVHLVIAPLPQKTLVDLPLPFI